MSAKSPNRCNYSSSGFVRPNLPISVLATQIAITDRQNIICSSHLPNIWGKKAKAITKATLYEQSVTDSDLIYPKKNLRGWQIVDLLFENLKEYCFRYNCDIM